MLTSEIVQSILGLQVRATYTPRDKKSRNARPVEVRAGVSLDRFDGVFDSVTLAATGNIIVNGRNRNRIEPGDRSAVTAEMVDAADARPQEFKGLPGEYHFRSLILDRITSLEVWRSGGAGKGRWEALLTAHVAETVSMPSQVVQAPGERREA